MAEALGWEVGSLSRLCTARSPDVAWMLHLPPPPMPANENPHPIQINLPGAEAIVHVPYALTHLIQQASGLQRRSAGFHGKFITFYLYGVSMASQGCKPLSGESHVRNIEHGPVYRACFAPYITLGSLDG